MLTDAGALMLSLFVIRIVQSPAGERMTYGLRRAEVLSGQANSAVLLVLGAIGQLRSRHAVDLAAGGRGQARHRRRGGRRGRQPGGGVGAGEGESPEHERRRQLPAHPDRSLRVHRDAHRRDHHRHDRIRPCGRDRVAVRSGTDDSFGGGASTARDPRAARMRAGWHGAERCRLGHGACGARDRSLHDLHPPCGSWRPDIRF